MSSPRLERYLAGLPGGFDAHPGCLAKGALVRNLLEHQPLVAALAQKFPEPLRRLAAEPPVGSEWVPEVHFSALLLAVADARELTGPQLLSWTRDRNRALFRSPAYRILMAVASPAMLLRFAPARWANWHRGTSLEVIGVADDGVRVTLGFPRGLFDATLVRVYAEAFTAALELANARKPRVDLLAEEPGVARYRASWQ